MATVSSLVASILARLAMEDDLAVPTYTENRIIEAIKHRYTVVFDSFWLPEYTITQEERVLDGITGKTTAALAYPIDRFADIRAVFHENYIYPLPRRNTNHRLSAIDNQNMVMDSDLDVGRRFKVIPATSTGKVFVSYRTRLTAFGDAVEIPVDEQLIILGVCFDILEDDGTNPGAADKFRTFYTERMSQINMQQFQNASSTSPAMNYPTRWT